MANRAQSISKKQIYAHFSTQDFSCLLWLNNLNYYNWVTYNTKLFAIGQCTMASNCKLQWMNDLLLYMMVPSTLIVHTHTNTDNQALCLFPYDINWNNILLITLGCFVWWGAYREIMYNILHELQKMYTFLRMFPTTSKKRVEYLYMCTQ